MGRVEGERPSFGLICNDPLCAYEPISWLDEPRDAYIVALAQDGVKITTVSKEFGLSRQRVYQIFDKWKGGV